jgi:hypothetical protein
MSYDIQTDGNKPAPLWFWISLALIVIASIIAYMLLQHDKETNQLEMEKKIATIATHAKKIFSI